MRRKMFAVIVTLALALGHVASADAPTLAIQQQATLDPAGVAVTVSFAVNCNDPEPSEPEMRLFQAVHRARERSKQLRERAAELRQKARELTSRKLPHAKPG